LAPDDDLPADGPLDFPDDDDLPAEGPLDFPDDDDFPADGPVDFPDEDDDDFPDEDDDLPADGVSGLSTLAAFADARRPRPVAGGSGGGAALGDGVTRPPEPRPCGGRLGIRTA
jgi:hypothetical protein